MRSALALVSDILDEALQPRRDLTVTGWADAHRVLSVTSSSEPGNWRTERTPYLAEIMNALSDGHPAEDIVFMKGSQLGATEAANNWIGYTLDWSPAPMLMVYPTKEMARLVSQQRITPLLEESPALRERISDVRSRDAANSTFAKQSDNGAILLMAGANSPSGLKGMPIGRLIFDEEDEYDRDVAGQGDPCSLAEKRTSNFPNRKRLHISTPTHAETSRILENIKTTDWRRYEVKCPHCGKFDWIQWRIGGWSGRDGRHHHIYFTDRNPKTACLRCSECDELIPEHFKSEMLAGGHWKASQESRNEKRIGFHLPGLYSPHGWRSWEQCVEEFLQKKDDVFQLKDWVNQVLGEPWVDPGDTVDVITLASRREEPKADVPHGVGILVGAVDVQGDRLEAIVRGFGAGEESWLIGFKQIYGDLQTQAPWFELSEFLKQDFTHESGQTMRVTCAAIDSRYEAQLVFKFCRAHLSGSVTWDRREGGVLELAADADDPDAAARQARRLQIFPIRGTKELGRPLLGRPSTANSLKVPVFPLCVDTGKDLIFARLRIAGKLGQPTPGYMHLPTWIDIEYLEQLTAEKKLTTYDKKNRGVVRTWHQTRKRNEAFDLEVYALASLYMLGPAFLAKLESRAERYSKPVPAGATPTSREPIRRRTTRKRGWVRRF